MFSSLARAILVVASSLLICPAFARDPKINNITTVVAGARIADEMCPTLGQQERGWTKLSNFNSIEFSATDFETEIAAKVAKLRPTSEARATWCEVYKIGLRNSLANVTKSNQYKTNKYVRAAVCELRYDYLDGPKCVEP